MDVCLRLCSFFGYTPHFPLKRLTLVLSLFTFYFYFLLSLNLDSLPLLSVLKPDIKLNKIILK